MRNPYRSPRRALVACSGALAMLVFLPVAAEAQRRPPRHPTSRTVVFLGASPWGSPGHLPVWEQGRGRYPGRYYGAFDDTAVVRIDVEPTDAEVYVDGYVAGRVDDFDGIFQRLRLPPGGHEIVIYREGYRTVRRNIYLQPDATATIRDEMTPLAPGERAEPPPSPAESATERPSGSAGVPRPGAGRRPPSDERPESDASARVGTLSLHVQPGDAEIFIDDERFSGRIQDGRVALRLAEGRHRVEIRKDGYARYTEEVLIRRGATLALDVTLKR